MKTIKKEIQLFDFSELSETAKQFAIDDFIINGISSDWHDFIIDDFKDIGEKIGIDIDNIYFSGFCSQGDGAQFTGNYEYKKGALKTIKKEYPLYNELIDIVQALQDEQKDNFYQLSASVTGSGNYSHRYANIVDVCRNDEVDFSISTVDQITHLLRCFMDEIYSTLEKEYDYICSEEYISEFYENNPIDFLIDGSIY